MRSRSVNWHFVRDYSDRLRQFQEFFRFSENKIATHSYTLMSVLPNWLPHSLTKWVYVEIIRLIEEREIVGKFIYSYATATSLSMRYLVYHHVSKQNSSGHDWPSPRQIEEKKK